MADGEYLRALIQERHDQGWSYRKIAQQSGGTIGHTFVQKLATRPRKRMPPLEELEALARGLDMPTGRILEAARKDWTTSPTLHKAEAEDGTVLIIASQLEELPADAVQTVKDIVDTLYRRMKEEERRRANG